jgi:L-fucose isomerase-like protein
MLNTGVSRTRKKIDVKIALLITNCGFCSSEIIESARRDMLEAFFRNGIECLTNDVDLTRYGAIETTADGKAFSEFLESHHGEYDGIVVCLPNFGDENGVKAAIQGCTVPILLQAYPDEIGKIDFEHIRAAFCGKLGLTSVLKQMGVKYTSYPPFVVHPLTREFDDQLRKFAGVCRVVKKMRRVRLGAIGARTTSFKSVRFDEVALEHHGIDVETYDLSSIFERVGRYGDDDPSVRMWAEHLEEAADTIHAPEDRKLVLAKFGAAVSELIEEASLDTVAIRCWSELQEILGIAPCIVLGVLNHLGIPAACEMDVMNAVSMLALSLASEKPSGCLDWYCNFGVDPDKCILFHCGPLPIELMEGPGTLEEHKMLSKVYGSGRSWGLNGGRIREGEATFASARTENGTIQFYVGKGVMTDDSFESQYFGVTGVLETPGLQKTLGCISENGFRHHVTITSGDVVDIVSEAFVKYLGYRQVDIV